MPKEVKATIRIQIPAGRANPSPPVGPALGQHGVNIMEFCKQFNAKTASEEGMIIPVVITIFKDCTFTFEQKQPPASMLLKHAAHVAKGSGEPNARSVGRISVHQLREIAQQKMPDLNARSSRAAMRIIAGSARSMGITIPGYT